MPVDSTLADPTAEPNTWKATVLDPWVADVSGTIATLETSVTTADERLDVLERPFYNLHDFYPGAIYAPNGTPISHTPGDGGVHPISGYYANLAAAQVDYPFLTATTTSADAAAIQLLLNTTIAQNGAAICPPPVADSAYIINVPITVYPTDSRAEIAWYSFGIFYNFWYTGADNSSCWSVRGLYNSLLSAIKTHIVGDGSPTGIKAWDVDNDATRTACDGNKFLQCDVSFDASVALSWAWRVGHTGTTDISANIWDTCIISHAGTYSDGNIGWSIEHQNVLVCTWLNCFWANLSIGWTNKSSAGATHTLGGPGHTFLGCGGTNNNLEFEFYAPGPYVIHGGRWEVGKTFLSIPRGESPAAMSVDVAGVDLGWTSAPPSDKLIDIQASCSLKWDNNNVYGFNATAAMITINTGTGHAILTAHGGSVQRASDGAISTLTAVATYKDVHVFRTNGVDTQSILTS